MPEHEVSVNKHNKFRRLLRSDYGIDSYRVIGKTFNMILLPDDLATVVLAKLIFTSKDEYYLSNAEEAIHELEVLSIMRRIPAVLIIKFECHQSTYTVLKLSADKPIPISLVQNKSEKVTFLG